MPLSASAQAIKDLNTKHRVEAAVEANSPRVKVGRVWDFIAICKPMLEALQEQGMARHVAAWALIRPMILLGGNDARYARQRSALQNALKEGRG